MPDPLTPNPNFKVFNEDIEIKLKEIGDMIGGQLPSDWGFSLLLFNFGPGGDLFYTSNARRDDVVKMMKEFIAKAEAQRPSAGK